MGALSFCLQCEGYDCGERGGGCGGRTVVELLGLHLLELRGVRRLEADRVEAEVARQVVLADRPRLGGVALGVAARR
eukprot:3468102-Prymnesium_polylepis.1